MQECQIPACKIISAWVGQHTGIEKETGSVGDCKWVNMQEYRLQNTQVLLPQGGSTCRNGGST